ncbi:MULTISPECIES: PTS sugar transporter subunit IIB [Rhodoluna]|jgi:PTS system ascorbate-specific IIB component|uniref:PTS sugar transporter subunit IIB n=1 Tax=Rhodoluna TaxID=529883 RepID=UPI00110584EC|nr:MULTISPECIES: PTS sugar transporter subunit IIB [Rhodoluna]BDS48657.1 PTS ascorbate transporter subunit IIB [Rhodoluna sp. KAS3]
MKIIAVCGMGIGTSVLLKMNAEKVLRTIGVEATVEATDVKTARESRDAQIILTTADLAESLKGLPSEVITIDHFFDLEEITTKLSDSLL